MSDNYDELDPQLARQLDAGMKTGEAIELPFPVVYLWALNGQASYKSQGAALYYGGWAGKVEDINAAASQTGAGIPADWKPVTIATRDGKEFEAFTARSVLAAPLGHRTSWLFDGKRYPDYVEGGRRHLQVLVYLAEAQGSNGSTKIIPWGPAVLSAKGYQARNLLDAFGFWKQATAKARGKASPWAFFLSLGTFGKERQAVNVGKPGAQSPITPIVCGVPEVIDRDFLQRRYCGHEMLEIMLDFREQAADWLSAWKEQSQSGTQPVQGDGEGPENWEDEGIPF